MGPVSDGTAIPANQDLSPEQVRWRLARFRWHGEGVDQTVRTLLQTVDRTISEMVCASRPAAADEGAP